MRSIVEILMRIWPINRAITLLWRYLPFPRGTRSGIMRVANDQFLVGVMAVIQNDENQLLLVRNTYNPRYSWSLPGGWMGKHEQPEECIRRELFEETGFEIEVGATLGTWTRPRLPSIDIVFHCSIVRGTFQPSAEIVEARFFPLDELPDGLTPMHQQILDALTVTAGQTAAYR